MTEDICKDCKQAKAVDWGRCVPCLDKKNQKTAQENRHAKAGN